MDKSSIWPRLSDHMPSWIANFVKFARSCFKGREAQLDESPSVTLSETMLRSVRRQKALTCVVIILFFGGFLGWASSFDLASAALAPGVISPEGSKRPVQHLEGGIISQVLVRDGDHVKVGDPLVVLEDIQARSRVDTLRNHHTVLEIRLKRLLAERRGDAEFNPEALNANEELRIRAVQELDRLLAERQGEVNLDPETSPEANDDLHKTAAENMWRILAEPQGEAESESNASSNLNDEIQKAAAQEKEQFDSRRLSLNSQFAILDARVAQLEEEIKGLRNQIESVNVQKKLIALEIADTETLLAKGLSRRPLLLGLQRSEARLNGERAAARARIARAQQSIGEAKTQKESIRFQFTESVDQQIGEIRSEMVRIGNELMSKTDVLTRTTVNAPDDGIVVGLQVTSNQAVIRPGDVILEIVPENAELLVDAQVSPLDIDDIREGLVAQVHLSAYKQRHMPRIQGVVRHVSADRYEDDRTGTPYFLARIAIEPEELEELAPGVEILPGMPAEVMIRTGEQTLLNYLIAPVLDSLRRSFRET